MELLLLHIEKQCFYMCLLSGDNNCEEYLSEAIIYEMPISLRRLFAILLSLYNPNEPKLLWNTFKSYMIDDYIHENISSHDAELRALNDISCILESLASLNNKQQIAYDMIMEKRTSGSSGAFFIDGPGGTGKIFLYKALLSVVRSQNAIALAIASSGVVASLLPGGILLKMCKLIIWDEAPMVNQCAVEAVDKMLKDINDCNLPFGGKAMVLRGDFRQVLLIVPRGKKEDIIKASLIFSDLWPLLLHVSLVENMRAKFDPIFCDYLLRIGNGIEQQHSCEIFTYYSFDEAIDKSEQSLQEDFLNSLTSNGIQPHELKLKVNCPVILLRNINPSEGCNFCLGVKRIQKILIYRATQTVTMISYNLSFKSTV
ncbi:uncharacterized protein LOC111407769 [Olea europaea var. sylvestris]|uniref:uncharacterized protein LOC111407769 n=1 Tax=Olea europaea var. sylvestris TaxID=158386 RepID=UPI000C1D4D37|nr:uncharacterized protein LOC111407769 [Olea europaea var. sylvestris]